MKFYVENQLITLSLAAHVFIRNSIETVYHLFTLSESESRTYEPFYHSHRKLMHFYETSELILMLNLVALVAFCTLVLFNSRIKNNFQILTFKILRKKRQTQINFD